MVKMKKKGNEKFFVITRLHKDDMKSAFQGNKKMLEEIEKLTDEEMAYIAGKLANDYCEQLFWESLEIITEDFIENKKK